LTVVTANEVLDQFEKLNHEGDRLTAKLKAAQFPVGPDEPLVVAQQMANFRAGLKKFKELRRLNQILGNLLAAMDATKDQTLLYEKMLRTIERLRERQQELNRLLDASPAVRYGILA